MLALATSTLTAGTNAI